MATIEDLHPQLLLELLDHRTQCRLGDITVVGGTPKVAKLIERLDIFELL